jgi:hypothetical protein
MAKKKTKSRPVRTPKPDESQAALSALERIIGGKLVLPQKAPQGSRKRT